MKYIISILFFSSIMASEIRLEYTNQYHFYKKPFISYISATYGIPNILITSKEVLKCHLSKSQNILVFCVDNEQGPTIVSALDIIDSFKVFRN